VNNSEKVTLLSFNITAVFLHDVMVSENGILEAGSAVDVFVWLTCRPDCKFELHVEWIRANPEAFEFLRSRLCSTVLTFAVIEKVISTRKA